MKFFVKIVNAHGGFGTTGDETCQRRAWRWLGKCVWAVRTVQSRYSAPISAGEVWIGLEAAATAEISPLSRFCAVMVPEGNEASLCARIHSVSCSFRVA